MNWKAFFTEWIDNMKGMIIPVLWLSFFGGFLICIIHYLGFWWFVLALFLLCSGYPAYVRAKHDR